MNLVVAIFAGLWFWFASGCWGYTFHYVLKQPLVMALPFGILMGDIPTAMIIGATIELVYVGIDVYKRQAYDESRTEFTVSKKC